jgi:hypothetical protein
MTSRREFLHRGVAVLASPILGHVRFLPASPAWSYEPSMPFHRVLFDARFAACRAFADEAQHLGLNIHEIRGDITNLWFNDLHARWKKGPAAIAGLTRKDALFCLDLLARDQRMHLVFLGEHVCRSEGPMEHMLSGPPDVLRQAAGLQASGPEWTSRVAKLMSRFPGKSSLAATPPVTTPLVRVGDDPGHLVSWVIAPRRSA